MIFNLLVFVLILMAICAVLEDKRRNKRLKLQGEHEQEIIKRTGCHPCASCGACPTTKPATVPIESCETQECKAETWSLD